MKRQFPLFLFFISFFSLRSIAQTGTGSRMNEVFQKTDLIPAASGLLDPWEITYGSDDSLWITESKGYKVYKMHPDGGAKRTILDISQKSTWLGTTPTSDSVFNLQFVFSNLNPQGGLAGLAIHPDFNNATTPKKYVYISYIRDYISTAPSSGGVFFKNRLVRFTYNTLNGRLEHPVSLCDTLPGSSDHNSQRIIIAPVNGVNYIFYANGDMGAGQFGNANRTENAQNLNSYEGKILRFNLEADGDAGLDAWIPDDNPFNTTSPAKESAIWSLGIRNNQGFAYGKINGLNYMYGSSHGPFSDDEVNIIAKGANYGHPLVIGFKGDGNYDMAGAGNTVAAGTGSLPFITSESANASSLTNYTDPIYCFYSALKGSTSTPSTSATNTVQRMYYDFNHGSQGNGAWPSEAPSGLDLYTKSTIPGWKNSLLLAALKGYPSGSGGKVIRLQLNSTGTGVVTSPNDTIGYFKSVNRFRDIAISPDGRTIYTVIDKSSTTSGPTTGNPIISACGGCVQKYTFLGYAPSGGTSTIPTTIPIAAGQPNICEIANTITIDPSNNMYWVPITDTNSNVIAEINANGNNLGDVTTSLFTNTLGAREQAATKILYLNRNITITPETQPTSAVSIRIYLSSAEFTALKNATNSSGQASGVAAITDLSLFKNSNSCSAAMSGAASLVSTTTKALFGTGGYVLQGTVNTFSTFYIAKSTAALPVHLLSFTGTLLNSTARLKWITDEERGTKEFAIEQSTDGNSFKIVGEVPAKGASTYMFTDSSVAALATPAVYYRLKTIDADGQFSYSNVITLQLDKSRSNMTIHPNPAINEVNAEIIAVTAEKVGWQLTDVTGNIVMQKTAMLLKGNNTINIKLDKLAAGIYYLKVAGQHISQSIKLQKL